MNISSLHFLVLYNNPILLQVGQEIEVRPGIVSKTQDGKIQCIPIFSRIVSLFTEQNELQYAVPGGLIGRPLASYNNVLKNLTYMIASGYSEYI